MGRLIKETALSYKSGAASSGSGLSASIFCEDAQPLNRFKATTANPKNNILRITKSILAQN